MGRLRRRTLLTAASGTVAVGIAGGGTARADEGSAGTGGAASADGAGGGGGRKGGPYDAKVRALLGRMTVDEKLGQLQQLSWTGDTGPGGGQTAEAEEAARKGKLGSVLNVYGAKSTNALQRIAVEESRLGIPLLFGLDVIHGFWTTFPIPLAQASSFDPAVSERDGEVSAKEARSNGVHWTFSPMMDVTHEPRWGRIAEGSGEDTYLAAAFAAAKTRGYQGDREAGGLAAKDRVAACAKHFVAYGGAEGGRDYNTVDVSEAKLRNVYLPPFKAALDAGVATVMASFNTISGVPAHGNQHTLTDILKKEWGFDGFVVSDYTGIQELIAHGFAADGADAGRLALGAGVDMEMVSTHLVDHGRKLLKSGRITVGRLDDAVARILRLKFELGLFDHPYVDEDSAITEPSKAARSAARKAAARSMVLLKNDQEALPLSPSVGSVAVVGPFADSTDLHGTWSGPGAQKFPAVTVADAVRAAAPKAKVTAVKGVDAEGKDTSGVQDAVAAAKAADVTVVVVGEPPAWSGEASSRSDITLPGAQEELISAIAGTGKPFVVVLVNGRPLTVGGWLDSAPAVLEAWHPGIEAGHAIADVLFGTVNPGGKLPVTFPRTVGQVPIYYNHENTGRPYDADNKYTSKYLDLAHGPQFAFGHGLSYTSFSVGEPKASTRRISAGALRKGDTVEVAVSVRNTGERAGDEVVQLYLHDPVASIVQPVRRLRGFRRVSLEAGKSTTVRFRLRAEDFGFWTNDTGGTFVLEKGDVDIYVGNSSLATNKTSLTIA
ncbi:glycoside hydrolase family 3 N-terminal domain-containing protein [Streptomyces luomodiensis]|uniref:beta-glucosidase n=1 Tax=Streptomyces luomodiensis TaxID=3026192 RepID=A0ABY9UQR8_9ACTN|nr:glycoside hydrolase family 3 N-terminal domain-containing protein [Streptomyces sp. SCA4-21]WNE94199.1 glycoside hydrolase family 3 N-terminal domain-containing protein [Streptomyces sp. SCA4-21]